MPFAARPPRYPTHIPVIVTQDALAQSGTIVDINAYGACVEGLSNLGKGDNILLRGAIESSIATVRWHEDDRTGVYFERAIPPQHLAMLRLRGTFPLHATQRALQSLSI